MGNNKIFRMKIAKFFVIAALLGAAVYDDQSTVQAV